MRPKKVPVKEKEQGILDSENFFDQYLSLVNRLIPKASAPPVIGIDIGTSSIKVSGIRPCRQVMVLRYAAGPSNHWPGNDTKAAAKKKIGERLHFTNQVLVSAVFARDLIRYVDLPRMPLEELRKYGVRPG